MSGHIKKARAGAPVSGLYGRMKSNQWPAKVRPQPSVWTPNQPTRSRPGKPKGRMK